MRGFPRIIHTFDTESKEKKPFMKQNRFFVCVLATALLVAALLSGCASSKLAAKVGDREITAQQLENAYNNSTSYATYYGYPLTTAEEIEAYQDYLLDSLIRDEMIAYQARQAGLTLTDEETAQAKQTAQESYDSTYKTFTDAAGQSGASDVNAQAQKLFTDALLENGTTVGRLKKDLLQDAEDALLTAKQKATLIEDATLSAEELKAKYDEELASQQAAIEASPAAYFTYETNASYGYGCMPLLIPEGLFRVKHILVEDEETANEVKAKLDAGEDFETLLAEYGTDPGMKEEANANGYLVGEGASYATAFIDAALALKKEGDVSEPVKSDYGYHIIKRMADEPARVIPYEEIQADFDAYIQSTEQETFYNGIVEEWMDDATLVTRYPENYRSIGKAALAAVTPTPETQATPASEGADQTIPDTTAEPAVADEAGGTDGEAAE